MNHHPALRQTILTPDNAYAALFRYLRETGARKILLVHGNSAPKLAVWRYLTAFSSRLAITVLPFTDFSPNPRCESVASGVTIFREQRCDMMMAIGGGSAIDVAKCIKLYAEAAAVPFLAVPTTAGSGSEATRYAVIYRDGEKQSVTDETFIPSAVLMDPSALATLPPYQKKSALLDAMCHAVESWWSVNADETSIGYAREALTLILENKDRYLSGDLTAAARMLYAANLAGRAINITQTTAGHAMCYKLTSLYGFAHGHAAALCTAVLWPYMAEHMEDCIDRRGKDYLAGVFRDIAMCLGARSVGEALDIFPAILREWGLGTNGLPRGSDGATLAKSVHLPRLKNNPVRLKDSVIAELYRKISRDFQ